MSLELAPLQWKCSPSFLGASATWGEVAWPPHSDLHVPSLPRDTDSPVVCRSIATTVTFIPQFNISLQRKQDEMFQIPRKRKTPLLVVTRFHQHLLFCLEPPRGPLGFRRNVFSLRRGDHHFWFHQAEPHLGLPLPPTKNNAAGSRPKQTGVDVSWWLPHWQVSAGRRAAGKEQLRPRRQSVTLVNRTPSVLPLHLFPAAEDQPHLGAAQDHCKDIPTSPWAMLSSSVKWLIGIKHDFSWACLFLEKEIVFAT